jgi:hypothetical protein
MKTLVIHPYDQTTDFLKVIYEGTDWTVININTSKKAMIDAIKDHDHIIMLGHGSPYGLLGYGRYYIDSTYVYLLREKQCTCIWCNADEFVQKYKLKGLYTGMIISEVEEAVNYCVPATYTDIWESNRMFAGAVKEALQCPKPLSTMRALYEGESEVIMFNKERMYYI